LRDNPYAVLLAKLAGVTTPPKARQGYQQFMRESFATVIAPVVEERWKAKSIKADGSANTGSPNAPFRCAIARELFNALPEEEQTEIRGRAVEEGREAKAAYEKGIKEGAAKSPEARQRCVWLYIIDLQY
jgi:hypothetical protein